MAKNEAVIEDYAGNLENLETDPDRLDLAWQLGLDAEVIDVGQRRREIRNFFQHLERPAPLR